VTPVRELAGKGCGEEGDLTRDRFASLHRVEGLPAGSCGGDGGCRPRCVGVLDRQPTKGSTRSR
jgi:hypothetical protein